MSSIPVARTAAAWLRLTAPHPSIQPEEQRVKARILISLALVSVFLYSGMFLQESLASSPAELRAMAAIGTIIMLLGYFLSRSRYFRVVAMGCVISSFVTAIILTLQDERYAALTAIAILTAGLYFQAGVIAAISTICLIGINAVFYRAKIDFSYTFFINMYLLALGLAQLIQAWTSHRAWNQLEQRTQQLATELTERHRIEQALRQSEERYRQVVESQTELIYRCLPDTTLTFVNEAFARFFSTTVEGLIGKRALDLTEEAFHSMLSTRVNERLKDRQSLLDEQLLMKKGGEHRWVSWINQAVLNDQGEIIEIQGVGRDTTELHQMRTALHQSQQRLEGILNSIQDMVWSASADDFHIQYCSPAVQPVLGYPAEAFYGNHALWLAVIHPDDQERVKQAFQTAAQRDYGEAEYRIIKPNGDIRWIHNHFWRVGDASNLSRVDGVVSDVTTRKVTQQQVFDLALEKERTMLMSRFIQDASHEFRTPLSVISSSIYLFLRVKTPEQRQAYAQHILSQVQNITVLLDSLVLLTQLDGCQSLDIHTVDLNALVKTVTSALQEDAQAKQITLRASLDADLKPISAHAIYLNEALRAVLHNAIRYTPDNGAVTIQTYRRDTHIIIDIQDSGIGMSEDVIPHIFERFYRLDKAHSTRGLGLGLSIAQKIMRLHGGGIEVESKAGEGSTFRLCLPQSRESLQAQRPVYA